MRKPAPTPAPSAEKGRPEKPPSGPRIVEEYGEQKNRGPTPTKKLYRGGKRVT
jgi:hypothetical protein